MNENVNNEATTAIYELIAAGRRPQALEIAISLGDPRLYLLAAEAVSRNLPRPLPLSKAAGRRITRINPRCGDPFSVQFFGCGHIFVGSAVAAAMLGYQPRINEGALPCTTTPPSSSAG